MFNPGKKLSCFLAIAIGMFFLRNAHAQRNSGVILPSPAFNESVLKLKNTWETTFKISPNQQCKSMTPQIEDMFKGTQFSRSQAEKAVYYILFCGSLGQFVPTSCDGAVAAVVNNGFPTYWEKIQKKCAPVLNSSGALGEDPVVDCGGYLSNLPSNPTNDVPALFWVGLYILKDLLLSDPDFQADYLAGISNVQEACLCGDGLVQNSPMDEWEGVLLRPAYSEACDPKVSGPKCSLSCTFRAINYKKLGGPDHPFLSSKRIN